MKKKKKTNQNVLCLLFDRNVKSTSASTNAQQIDFRDSNYTSCDYLIAMKCATQAIVCSSFLRPEIAKSRYSFHGKSGNNINNTKLEFSVSKTKCSISIQFEFSYSHRSNPMLYWIAWQQPTENQNQNKTKNNKK